MNQSKTTRRNLISLLSFLLAATMLAMFLYESGYFRYHRKGQGRRHIHLADEIRAFRLRLKVVSDHGSSWHEILYQRHGKWSSETIFGVDAKLINVCDSDTAWRYYQYECPVFPMFQKQTWIPHRMIPKSKKVLEYTRTNVRLVTDILGKEGIYGWVRPVAFGGVHSLANPSDVRWKKDFGWDCFGKEFDYEGKGVIDGINVLIYYGGNGSASDPIALRLWFGEDDGILRQQVAYRVVSGREEELIKWSVADLVINPDVKESCFICTPPEVAVIIDDTSEIISHEQCGVSPTRN